MSSGCGDVLSLEDMKTAKKHQVFEAEVITGKSGGVAGGADIDEATNPVTGQTQDTLPAVIEFTRKNLIPLGKQYMTLADAQADIANIPEGSTTYYRSPDDSALAIEVINNGGILSKTGRVMQSRAYTDGVFAPLSDTVNDNFNSLVSVLAENMALKETVTSTRQLKLSLIHI